MDCNRANRAIHVETFITQLRTVANRISSSEQSSSGWCAHRLYIVVGQDDAVVRKSI